MVNKAFFGCSVLSMFFFSEQLRDLCICASHLQFKPPGIANYITISLSDLGQTKNSMRPSPMFYTFISPTMSSSMLGKSWHSGPPASTTLSRLLSMLCKFSHVNGKQTPERSSCWWSFAASKQKDLHSGGASSSAWPEAPLTLAWKAALSKTYKLFANWMLLPLAPC